MAVDFRELEQFRDKIQKIGEHGAAELCNDCAKELSARLLRKVIKRTPVGVPGMEKPDKDHMYTTETGESGKKKKFLSAEGATYQQYWGGYAGGTLRRGWTANGVAGTDAVKNVGSIPINVMSNDHRIAIINQVSYAMYVEYGHRQQPGRYVPALGRCLKASWVPGRFMLRDSVTELDATAQKVVDQKVKQYLKKELGHE
jgi:hypothetical protein